MEKEVDLEKSEKLILKAFIEAKTPIDFDKGVSMTLLVDSVHGLVDRALSNEKLTKDEIDRYTINKEMKDEISKILSNNINNLLYYNLIKSCFLILYKYSS